MNTGLGGSAWFAIPSFTTKTFCHFTSLDSRSLLDEMMALHQIISEVLPAITVSSSKLYTESIEE